MLPEPPAPAAPSNPFPGLRPFEPHEYHLFFGRDGQSDELLRRLRQKHFVAVIGTSGSGKSSLVRAGLLPSLHGGLMVTAGSRWRVTIFRPGANPIGHLADALNGEDALGAPGRDPEISRAIIEATLRRGALGLVDAVRQARLPEGENLLIVVDQFEEIFRFKSTAAGQTADDAAAFVKLLLEATARRDLPVYVIITMRSDFLGDCAQFRDLPEAINDGQYLIPRMTRDQRREAVAGPVAVGGAEITPRLVNRLLNDVGDNPDQLPILQHALMRTWQQWAHGAGREGPLDIDHYQSIGGMAEALSRHADKAYNELPGERSKAIAEKLFKLLTERGGDNRETRRPTRLDEISAVAEASEGEVVAVIERFRRDGRSFLMPPAGLALDSDTLVDISHESLIRGWERLRGWVDDEAQSARTFRRLAETAALHRAGEASLWRDPDLGIALRWRETNRPNAAWGARYSPDFDAAMEFLEASQRARDEEREERVRQRRKTLRLTQALAAVLLVGFILSLGLTVYAFRLRAEAFERTREAEASAQRATEAETKTRQEKERAEREEAAASEARDEAQRMAGVAERSAEKAEQSAEEARAALAAAERAKADALRSAADARRAQLAAESERQKAVAAQKREEVARQNAEQSARRAAMLATRLLNQDLDNNLWTLDTADRIARLSSPSEKPHWHFVKASAHSNLHQYGDAIRELSEVIRLDGKDSRALTNRSYKYLLTNNPEAAVEDARAALGISPNNAAAWVNLVVALSANSLYGEAEQSLSRGIERFMHFGYGQFSESDVAREIQEATGQGILVVESDDMLTALNYERAILAAASGADFAPALAAADKRPRSVDAYLAALNWTWLHERLNPKDYGVLAMQGALWARAGYPQQAARAYAEFQSRHAAAREPRYDATARWVRGPEALSPGAAGEARGEARALSLNATLAGLRGEDDEATALHDKAVAADPDNLDARMKRAYFLYSREKFDRARADFDYVLQREKHNAPARLTHTLAGLRTEPVAPPEEIRGGIAEARRLDPTVVPSSFELSQYGEKIAGLIAERDPDAALDFLERGAKFNPPDPETYFVMAKFLNGKGDHARALEKIKIAIEMRGDRSKYYAEKARAEAGLRAAARSGPAREAETAARAEARDYAEQGDSMIKFGNPDAALDAYGKSLKVLDRLALAGGVEGVRCEVVTLLGKIGRITEARLTKEETAEYLQSMYGDLKGIEGIVRDEVKRLSPPRGAVE